MTTQEGLPALATDAELAELLAGLKGVTPGPWYISTDDDGEQFIEAKYQTSPLSTYVVSIAYEMRDAELRYLPLVSPDRIRALLARLEAAERQVKHTEALERLSNFLRRAASTRRDGGPTPTGSTVNFYKRRIGTSAPPWRPRAMTTETMIERARKMHAEMLTEGVNGWPVTVADLIEALEARRSAASAEPAVAVKALE
jgi:hypothetical protein